MDEQDLKAYDSLPSLLEMARERSKLNGGDLYETQDALREEYRKRGEAFRWSMPYRHLFRCEKCGLEETAVYHELENPAVRDEASPLHLATLWEEEVHEVREHEGSFSEECITFLRSLADYQERKS